MRVQLDFQEQRDYLDYYLTDSYQGGELFVLSQLIFFALVFCVVNIASHLFVFVCIHPYACEYHLSNYVKVLPLALCSKQQGASRTSGY